MKFFEKLCLVLFSIIIFVISVTIVLISLDFVEVEIFSNVIEKLLDNSTSQKITIITSIILIILSMRFILFRIGKKEMGKDGIVLENSNGKLIISKESLENMIVTSTKQIDGIGYINSRTLIDNDHNLMVYVTILVEENVLVKEVSKLLQDKIKLTMKNTADLEVSSVVITVKNIGEKKNKQAKKISSKEKEQAENVEEVVTEEKEYNE